MGGSESTEAGPKALQRARMMVEENRVMLFSRTTCPYCSRVKSLLNSVGVRPSVCEIDKEEDGEEIMSAVYGFAGERTTPALFINGRFIGGCDAVQTCHYNGQLVPILKSAGAL